MNMDWVHATRGRVMLWIIWLVIAIIQCNGTAPTTNPVQSIDLDALDELITSDNFNGLVVAMASWCPPCREELPVIAKLYQQYHIRGIQIIAISLDADGPTAVQPLINKLRIPFPVYWVGTKAIQPYGISGVPTLFVVDKGVILEKLPGSHPKRVLESKIKKLLL